MRTPLGTTNRPKQSIALVAIGLVAAILFSACSVLPFGGSEFAEPQTVAVNRTFSHPGGVSINLQTVSVTAESTVIDVAINNPRPTQVRINGCCNKSYLLDSAGNTYPLASPPGNLALLIDGEASMQASLVFPGPLSGDAETLQFVFNDRGEGGLNDAETPWPEFRLGPISVGDTATTSTTTNATSNTASNPTVAASQAPAAQAPVSQAAQSEIAPARPAFQQITVGQRYVHPNSVIFDLHTIQTVNNATLIDVDIENPRRIAVRINGCCDTSYALDNLGNRYDLVPVPSNDDLLIARLSAISATLAFSGQLDVNATSVQFVFNDRDEGGLVDPDTSWPEFRLGPFSVAG